MTGDEYDELWKEEYIKLKKEAEEIFNKKDDERKTTIKKEEDETK